MQTTKNIFRKSLRWLEHIHLVHWIWERTHDIQSWQWGIMVLTAIITTIVAYIRDASASTIGLWALGMTIVALFLVLASHYKSATKPSPKDAHPAPSVNAQPKITILSPTDQSMVEFKQIVTGELTTKIPIEVWVYSFKSREWYLQNPVILHGRQRWSTEGIFGDKDSFGNTFALVAIEAGKIKVGSPVRAIPPGIPQSQTMRVTRKSS